MSEEFHICSDEVRACFKSMTTNELVELLFDRLRFEVSSNIFSDVVVNPEMSEMPPSEEIFEEIWDVFIPFVKKLSKRQFQDIDEPFVEKRVKKEYQTRFSKTYEAFCKTLKGIKDD